jgi:glycosyltransferase involved in cell wall biosynthesis
LRIAFYMPFKPLGHPHPSGDLIIGTELLQFLRKRGHEVRLVSRLRTRWIYWHPWQWIRLPLEIARSLRFINRFQPHVWLTYHSYYKAPDVLGPVCTRFGGVPYTIFQGVYATKHRRKLKSKPGFYINRYGLQRADAVFTNKRRDEINLKRLLPEGRLHYIAPGIHLDHFQMPAAPAEHFVSNDFKGNDGAPVILTVAMFRPGVKAEGIARVIRACGGAARRGCCFRLVVCGDGAQRDALERLAVAEGLEGCIQFMGQLSRDRMPEVYCGADIFAFPGIKEGLGMVYLEAQAAGRPVVACRGWGASEVVRHNETGLLSSPENGKQFEDHLVRLITDSALRRQMGAAASRHVARHHDLECNYREFEAHLQRLAAQTACR